MHLDKIVGLEDILDGNTGHGKLFTTIHFLWKGIAPEHCMCLYMVGIIKQSWHDTAQKSHYPPATHQASHL